MDSKRLLMTKVLISRSTESKPATAANIMLTELNFTLRRSPFIIDYNNTCEAMVSIDAGR